MENLILEDIYQQYHYVILQFTDRNLLVSYPSLRSAERACNFLLRILRTFAADGESRRSPKALAYVYSQEMTVNEFVQQYETLVSSAGLFSEWILNGK